MTQDHWKISVISHDKSYEMKETFFTIYNYVPVKRTKNSRFSNFFSATETMAK